MKDQSEKRIKVLFLAGWYPNKDNPISGIFIKRHAEAVSQFCEVAVLYIHYGVSLRKNTVVEYTVEEGIKTIRVYPKSAQFRNRILNYGFNKIYQNFFVCSYKGLKVVQKVFGKPDIIHVNVCLPMGILAVLLDIFKGIPYIITEHFTGFSQQAKRQLNYLKLKVILNRSKYICPVSNSLKQSIEQLYPMKKYQIIPNAINTNFFSPKFSKNIRLSKLMLHISTLKDRQKNISGILYAILELSTSRNDFELHIIGEGDDKKYLEKLAEQLKIKDKFVFFDGYVSELELLNTLQNSDFFILNSNYETFSVACAEALASGIPIIATRCGGPEEFVNDDVGLLIEKGNQQELVHAIMYMLDKSRQYNPNLIHEQIKNQFGYEIIGKQFFEVYQSLITKWSVGFGRSKILIQNNWIVGDIGSGHHPHRRADICIDRELGITPDRSGAIAIIPKDKAFILADAVKGLPLKEKVLDYTIASHIAEHVNDPSQFCKELSRVSKKGYIETPGPFSEFLLYEPYHKWIVSKKRGKLIFKKNKKNPSFCEIFYRIFYYGQIRYGHSPLKFENRLLNSILIINKYIINTLWKYIPYTYTYYEWEDKIDYLLEVSTNRDNSGKTQR